jgi:hypothetical protein
MTATVQVGTILIDDEPQLTRAFALKSEPYSGKWSVIEGSDGVALDRQLHAAGWNFFFMAAEMKVMFLGAIGAQRIQNALQRILRKVNHQNFNSLEVTGIMAKRFLGLPYATVSAHSRHIQQGRQLDDIERRRAAQRAAQGARG